MTNKLFPPLTYSIQNGEEIIEGYTTHKPTMEKYGYHSQSGFDDLPSGWMLEGGEEKYHEELSKWQQSKVAVKVDKELDDFLDKNTYLWNFNEDYKTINLDLLADRIEVRDIPFDELRDYTIRNVKRAFLIPVKEDKEVLLPEFNSPRNWTEDYELENGKYICHCIRCNKSFFGYKRRLICKECDFEDATDEQVKAEALPSLTAKYGKSFEKSYTIGEIEKEVNRVKELFRTNIDAYGKPKQIMSTLDSIINNLKK